MSSTVVIVILWAVCSVINFGIMMFLETYDGADTTFLTVMFSLLGPVGLFFIILYGLFMGMVFLFLFLDSVDITFKKKNPNERRGWDQ